MSHVNFLIDVKIKSSFADYMWRMAMERRNLNDVISDIMKSQKEHILGPEDIDIIKSMSSGWLSVYDGWNKDGINYEGIDALVIDRTEGKLSIEKCDAWDGIFYNKKLDRKRYKVIAWRKNNDLRQTEAPNN